MGSILEQLPCPESSWIAWMGIPLELLQAIFLHPYFQLKHPKWTKFYRVMVIPICVYLAFATLIRRTILPLDHYLHFNFGFTTMPTFHFVCLCFIFGLHNGPVFKSEVHLFKTHHHLKTTTNNHSNINSEKKPISSTQDNNNNNNSIDSHDNNNNNLRNRKIPSNNNNNNNNNGTKSDSNSSMTCPKNQPTAKPQDQSILEENIDSKCTTSHDMVLLNPPSIGELTRWIFALFMSPRGLICTWSPPESVVPTEKFPTYRSFIVKLILRTMMMHIWFQFVCALGVQVIKYSNGDINHFLFQIIGLPPFLHIIKLFSPFFLTVLLGGGAYSGFALAGGLFNIVEITTIEILRKILSDESDFKPLPVNPSNYPPLFNLPWIRTSLTEFWGKGWQAVFRHHFLFCGAQPMWLIFSKINPTVGKLTAVMGAMSLSAAMHEFCLVSISKFDPTFSSSRMFLSQGIGIVLEAIFKKVTGRKVSGLWGWLWTFSFIILNGKPMVDAWIQRDLGKGVVPWQEWSLLHYLVPFGPLITDEVYNWLLSWLKLF